MTLSERERLARSKTVEEVLKSVYYMDIFTKQKHFLKETKSLRTKEDKKYQQRGIKKLFLD